MHLDVCQLSRGLSWHTEMHMDVCQVSTHLSRHCLDVPWVYGYMSAECPDNCIDICQMTKCPDGCLSICKESRLVSGCVLKSVECLDTCHDIQLDNETGDEKSTEYWEVCCDICLVSVHIAGYLQCSWTCV